MKGFPVDKIVKSEHPGSMFYSENETGSDLVGSLGLMILRSVRIFMNSISGSGNKSAFDQALEFVKNESFVEALWNEIFIALGGPVKNIKDALNKVSTTARANIFRGQKCSNLNKINL